jgi:subtilisin family serine protease
LRPAAAGVWWVLFADKEVASEAQLRANLATTAITERRMARLVRAGAVQDASDLPVVEAYIGEVQRTGARIRTVSRWLNAVSVQADADAIGAISQLPCVIGILPVAERMHKSEPMAEPPRASSGPDAATARAFPFSYGLSLTQNLQLGVPEMHALGVTGDRVLIAAFDTGFRTTHPAFADLMADGRVLATRDFIFGDTSVANDSLDIASQDQHGTWVLGTLAGFAPGELIGPAFGADYILAKTEDMRSETPVEEDYYVAALEWADSIGADIVTSSLSYDFGYVMDGTEGISTVAANTAAARGILLCTAMGNTGPGAMTLGAPADAFMILAVGGVDAQGQIASFSSRGPTADGRTKPEICALGVNAYTAAAGASTGYVSVSGTSFATPLTAASVALLLAAHRDWGPLDLRDALMQSGDRSAVPDNNYGWGIFDLLAALEAHPPGVLSLDVASGGDRYDTSPWTIDARTIASGGRLPQAVTLHYAYEPGSSDSVTMTPVGDTLWTTDLPFAGEEGLRYYLVSVDSAGRAARFPPTEKRVFELLRQPDSLLESFEFGGLRWERKVETPPPLPAPNRPIWWVSALDVAAGDFALTDSPRGPYPPNIDEAYQMTRPLVISASGTWRCSYQTRFQIAAGDTGFVERRTGSTGPWTGLDTLTGTVGSWSVRTRAMAVNASDSLFIRFRLKSDAATEGDGWYLDDLRLAPTPLAVNPDLPPRPVAFTLAQNYPNPFNPSTVIEFELTLPVRVRMTVYNVAGRRVRIAFEGVLEPGRHRTSWDGTDDAGRELPSGVYLYRHETDRGTQTRKMLLVR